MIVSDRAASLTAAFFDRVTETANEKGSAGSGAVRAAPKPAPDVLIAATLSNSRMNTV